MIAVDTNILVYAHLRQSPWYARAVAVLADLGASGTPWGIPVGCLHEFFSVVTHPKIYKPASTPAIAIAQVDAWRESPTLTILAEDAGTWSILSRLVTEAKVTGPSVYDARIAATCLQHGVSELWTSDRDFTRSPSLRVRNPLIAPQPTRTGEARAAYTIGRRRVTHRATAR
jgi:toxin-antitoxin system PIN domain toxin